MRRQIIVLSIVALAGPARAGSDTHYQDVIVGERAAGMGGAFTALANEATGAYYNPAGIISEESILIQLSMSAYQMRRKEVEVGDLCGSTITEDQSAFFSFPAAFGFIKQFRTGSVHHGLGLALVIPHMEKTSQSTTIEDATCGSYTIGLGLSALSVDRVFWTGMTYAIKPWRFIQAGLTLGLSVRTASISSLTASLVQSDGGSSLPGISFINADVSLWSMFLQLGVITEPIEGLRLGLSFTTPYLRLSGSGRLDLIEAQADPADWQNTGGVVLDDTQYYWKVPFSLAIGGAYSRTRVFTVAADVRLHGEVGSYQVLEHEMLPLALQANRRALLANVNLGGEIYLGSRLALRAGFFTNLTSVPDDLDLEFYDRIHLFGFTAGGTLWTSESSALSFAVQTQIGTGKAQGIRLSYDSGIDDVTVQEHEVDARDLTLLISVGGSFDIR